MPPDLDSDAASIARRQFGTVRRGLDPDEVRAYLRELAEAIDRLRRGEAEQRARAEAAESRTPKLEDLDEHRLVELLGEETARILDAGRAAAADIRRKAEESAARLIKEANEDAHRLRAEAETERAARRVELMAEVDAMRAEAAAELDRCRAEGAELIEQMRRTAQAEADELVDEAQVVRERMLGDLARRRRAAREQLERLNAARERLLAAYDVVRRTVDEATSELTVALPEAKIAGDTAMRRVHDEPEPTVDELEDLVTMARIAGLIDQSKVEPEPEPVPAPEETAGSAAPAAPAAKASPPAAPAAPAPAPAAPPVAPAPVAGAQPAPSSAAPVPPSAVAAPPSAAPVPSSPVAGAVPAPPSPAARGGPGVPAPPPPSPHPPGRGAAPAPASPRPPVVQPGPVPGSPGSAARGSTTATGAGSEPPAGGDDRSMDDDHSTLDRAGEDAGADLDVDTGDGDLFDEWDDDYGDEELDGEAVVGLEPDVDELARWVDDEDTADDEEEDEELDLDDEELDHAEPELAAPAASAASNVDALFARLKADAASLGASDHAPDEPEPIDGERAPADQPVPEDRHHPEDHTADGRYHDDDADDHGGVGQDHPHDREDWPADLQDAGHDDHGYEDRGHDVDRHGEHGRTGGLPDADRYDEDERDLASAPVPGDDELVRQRDDSLGAVERDLNRRLKRVLADEQNEVLDLLRRTKPSTSDDLLSDLGGHAARYTEAAREELAVAAASGAAAVGGEPDGSCDALAVELAQTVVEPLRERIARSFTEAGGDLDEVTDRLRSLYREWKGQRIAAAVRHYAVAAYAQGAYGAVPEGTPLRWLVDRSSDPCPDADDNALAGAVPKGDAFPTGDHCPPAHLGCRCMVVPAE